MIWVHKENIKAKEKEEKRKRAENITLEGECGDEVISSENIYPSL